MNKGIWESYPSKLFAVGDIHGDYNVLVHILVELSQVCTIKNNILSWIPNNSTWIVFCGDLVDRLRIIRNKKEYVVDNEDSDIKILSTLMRLSDESMVYNGKVVILIGNHELMNFEHYFNYVPSKHKTSIRQKLFTPGSEFCKKLSKYTYVSVRIGKYVMVHGGFCEESFKNNSIFRNGDIIELLNTSIRNYLFYGKIENLNKVDKIIINLLINALKGTNTNESPLNCRNYGFAEPTNCLNTLNTEIFKYIYPSHITNPVMIIAHTPQFLNDDNINSICNGSIWRLDVGMSKAFDEHKDYVELLIKSAGLSFIKRLKDIFKNAKYRYVSILGIDNDEETVITKYKYASTLTSKTMTDTIQSIHNIKTIKKKIQTNKLTIPRPYEKEMILHELDNVISIINQSNI
jgi:hypothetical protein